MISSLRQILIFSALLLAGTAHGQVLVESFKNGTTSDPNWVFAGTNYTPVLTGDGVTDTAGDGWLRLTDTGGNIATSAYNNTAFSADGATIYASFEYASWGGSGADGIAFFLFDGSESFSVGANGGSLGYAQKTGVDGLAGGYVGVAIDEYGNFSNGTEGRVGGIGRTVDSISVRGDEASGYDYLGGSGTLATSIDTPSVGTRPNTVNTVQILLTATNQLTVTLQQGAIAAQTVLQLDLSAYDRPETLKLGFTSGTGGANNFHEVRNVTASTVAASLWDNQGDSTWGNASNWNPTNVPGVGADILFDNTYVSTNQTIDTESDRTVRSVSFDAGFDYTINNNTLIFDNGGVAGFSGINTSETNGSGDHTINSDLQANNDIFIRNNNTGDLTLNGDLDTGGNTITFDGVGDAATENGVISGSGALVKNDSGTLTLDSNNTYTGGTTVNGGNLNLTTGGSTGAIRGDLTINSGGTLNSTASNTTGYGANRVENITVDGGTINHTGNGDFGWSLDYTLSDGALLSSNGGTFSNSSSTSGSKFALNTESSITATSGTSTIQGRLDLRSGTGTGAEITVAEGADLIIEAGIVDTRSDAGFEKLGSGNLTLAGSNTYTGTTKLTDGTITLGASDRLADASDLEIGSGGTLNLNGGSERIDNLTSVDGGAIDFGTPGNANTFLFDTYTPPSGSGVLVIDNWSDADGDQLATTVASQDVSSIYISGLGVAEQQTGLTALGGSYGNGYLLTPEYIQEIQWEGTGTTWNTAGHWVENDVPSWREEIAIFGALGQDELDVNLDVTEQVGGIRFLADATESYTISSATNDLTMQGTVPYIQQLSDVDHTIAFDDLRLDANTVADITGSGNLTISADIVDASGNRALIRDGSGSGKLILNGDASTFSGGLFVNQGIVEAQDDTSLGTAAGTVSDGGTLELTTDVSIANNISIEGEGYGGNGSIRNTADDNTLSGVISGAGTVQVDADSLTLSGNNTYSGDTEIAATATLIATSDNALGTGNITINDGATLQLTGGIDVGQTNITVEGTGTAGNGAVQNVSGDNRLTGDITLAGDTTFQSDAGTLNIGTNVDGSVYNASGDQIALGPNDLTIDGDGATVLKADLTGTGSLIKDGDGQFTMANGTNAWTGTTEINDGEMVLATYFNDAPGVGPLVDFGIRGPVVIGDGTEAAGTAKLTLGTADSGAGNFSNMFAGDVDITVNSDGLLDTRGHTTYVRDIDLDGGSINAQTGAFGGNNLFVTGNITSTSTTQVATIDGFIDFNGDADQSINTSTDSTLDINARIQNGGIDKSGDGTLIVSGGNTFTDDVDVLGGIVRVDNNLGLGSVTGGTNVSSGAQLQLDGVSVGNEALSISGTGISGDDGALQTVTDSGANSWSGNVTVATNAEIQVNSGTTLGISGNITGSGKTLTIESIGDTTLSGTNTLNTLNKTGAGNLTVTTSPNTISTVNVNDGTFTVGTSNILNDSLDLNVGNDGTFAMGGGINETIDQFNSSGTLDIDGVFTMNGGIISGGTGVDSTGEMILTAGNTLEIASDFTYGTVGTMGGADQLGTLTLQDASRLVISGGSTVNIGSLNIDGDSIIDFTAAESNILNLGSLTFTAGSTLLIEGWNSFNDLWTTQNFPGANLDIRDDDTAKITFSGFDADQTIWKTFDFGSKEITVPEPSSYGAILMAFALAAWTTRRPRRLPNQA